MSVSVEHDGVVVDSNTGTEAELRTELGLPDADDPTPPAADAPDPDDAQPDVTPDRAAPVRNAAGQFTKPDAAKSKAGNPRHDPQARINEIIREREEARRERDADRAELARLRADLESAKRPAQAETKPAAPDAFTFPAFDQWAAQADHAEQSYEDYIEARVRASIRHDETQTAKQRDVEARRNAVQTALQAHDARLAAFKAEHPDYDDLFARSAITKILPPAHIGEAVVTSEHSAALLYYYLQHPAEYETLITLAPTAAIRAIGKLEASLSAAHSGSAASVPSEPKPKPLIKPVSGSAQVTDEEPGDEASDDEWRRWQLAHSRKGSAARR